MSVTINARGTSVPYFGIGKGGVTLYQGIEDPTLTHTVRNGDYWLDSSNNSLRVYSSTLSDWGAPRLDNLTFLDTTISSLGNDLILRPDDDRVVKVVTVDQDGNDVNGLITTENFRDLIIDPSIGGGGALKLGPLIWPLVDGTFGQVLATTGTGTLLWADSVPSTINNLVDVIITDPVDGQYLKYDPAIPGWKNASIESGVTSVGIIGNNGILVTNSPITSSGNISLDLGAITPGSVSTNSLTFSGVNAKIQGDFTTTPVESGRTRFQTSIANNQTYLATMPSGTNRKSGYEAYNTLDGVNAGGLRASVDAALVTLETFVTGTGTPLNMAFRVNGNTTLILEASTGDSYFGNNVRIPGNLTLAGLGKRILGDFNNVTIASRTTFQTANANQQTIVQAIPNGTGSTAGFIGINNSDPTNASYGSIVALNTDVRVESGKVGTGTYLPLSLYTGGLPSLTVGVAGEVTLPRGNLVIAGSVPALSIKDTDSPAATGFGIVEFLDNTNARSGYVGFGGNNTLQIYNQLANGEILLSTAGGSSFSSAPDYWGIKSKTANKTALHFYGNATNYQGGILTTNIYAGLASPANSALPVVRVEGTDTFVKSVLRQGEGVGQLIHYMNGGASGTAAGAALYIQNGGNFIAGIGNYSSIFGGAYNSEGVVVGANGLNFSPNGGLPSHKMHTNQNISIGSLADNGLAKLQVTGGVRTEGRFIAVADVGVNPDYSQAQIQIRSNGANPAALSFWRDGLTAVYFTHKANEVLELWNGSGGWGGLTVGVLTYISLVQSSDRTKKENIRELSLDKCKKILAKVNWHVFDMIDGQKNLNGVIAQELLDIYPDAVVKDHYGNYGVNYQLLYNLQMRVSQDLEQRLSRLEQIIAG